MIGAEPAPEEEPAEKEGAIQHEGQPGFPGMGVGDAQLAPSSCVARVSLWVREGRALQIKSCQELAKTMVGTVLEVTSISVLFRVKSMKIVPVVLSSTAVSCPMLW